LSRSQRPWQLGDRHHKVFIVVYDEHTRACLLPPFHGSPGMAHGGPSFKSLAEPAVLPRPIESFELLCVRCRVGLY